MTENTIAKVLGSVRSVTFSWPSAALLLTLAGCGHSLPPAEQPEEVFTPDCLEWARVQEPLAALGLKALEVLGRIDPGLYTSGEGNQELRLREGVVAPPEQLAPFQEALDRVGKDPKAREAFARGHANALQICGEVGCPPTHYAARVRSLPGQLKSDQLYHWTLEGPDFPTLVQWKAFRALYASRPDLCRVLPSLAIRNRATGMAQTAGLFAADRGEQGEEHWLKNPCPCGISGGYGRNSRPCSGCAYDAFESQCLQ